MDYFKNESDTIQLDGLTIENRVDGISLYGNIVITRDKAGLVDAAILHKILANIVQSLRAEEGTLPEHIEYTNKAVEVKNPFE